MAKRKGPNGGVNKSAAVRELLTQSPKMPVKEIVAAMAAKGLKVQPSTVYFLKGKMRRKQRKEIGKRLVSAGVVNPVDLILKVRSLAGEAGGIKKLKQLVDALAE